MFNSELRPRRYEQNKLNMALMQNAFKHQANTLKTWMQQGNMKLHENLGKFRIEHTQNGATVQHTLEARNNNNLRKQQLGTLQSSNQHATGII